MHAHACTWGYISGCNFVTTGIKGKAEELVSDVAHLRFWNSSIGNYFSMSEFCVGHVLSQILSRECKLASTAPRSHQRALKNSVGGTVLSQESQKQSLMALVALGCPALSEIQPETNQHD